MEPQSLEQSFSFWDIASDMKEYVAYVFQCQQENETWQEFEEWIGFDDELNAEDPNPSLGWEL